MSKDMTSDESGLMFVCGASHFRSLSVCLSVCLRVSVCLCLCVSICLCVLSLCLCLSVYFCVCGSVSVYLCLCFCLGPLNHLKYSLAIYWGVAVRAAGWVGSL